MEILARRGGPVDAHRGSLRTHLGAQPTVAELVACLVDPYASLVATAEGRSYVRIVAQLRGRFAAWRVESDEATTAHLATILDELESRVPGPRPLRRERIVALIMLLTGMVAERARRIDEGAANETTEGEFVDDLTAMCAAVVQG